MLLKNDKIVLTEDLNGLKKGTEFYIIDITEDGVIHFKNDTIGFGFMNIDEFNKSFKKEIKREFSERVFRAGYGFRHNGKVVEVSISGDKGSFHRAVASCHEDDIFDLETGIEIAKARAYIKLYQKRIEEYIK